MAHKNGLPINVLAGEHEFAAQACRLAVFGRFLPIAGTGMHGARAGGWLCQQLLVHVI